MSHVTYNTVKISTHKYEYRGVVNIFLKQQDPFPLKALKSKWDLNVSSQVILSGCSVACDDGS